MDLTASSIFSQFSANGAKALDLIRETSYSPKMTKTLREWGITEVSEMVGRSANYIRKQEKEKKIPSPRYDQETKKRVYSLEEINFLRSHFTTSPTKHEKDEAAIIAFANFKGGAAKTTSAVNTAQYMAKKGYRTLLIDCDSQASATQVFGYVPDEQIKEDETLLPILTGDFSSLSKVIRKTYWTGLDLVPANLALYNAEFILPVKNVEAEKTGKRFEFYGILHKALEEFKSSYDVIILDCPPSMGMISINAIYAANSIIIPAPPAMLDFTSTVQFFDMLYEVLSRLPEKHYKFIRMLITKHDGRASSDGLIHIMRQLYGKYVMLNMMYNSEVIKKASADMCTIYEVSKYSGAKKTFDRAMQYTDAINGEIERLIQKTWSSQKNIEQSIPEHIEM